MRVICTYQPSSIRPETLEAIGKYAPQCEFKETVGIFGYNEVMLKAWGHDDLVVIEADKVITADVIPSFKECDLPWCVYSYWSFPPPYRREVYTGLGCTRYSLEFQKQFPPALWLFGDDPDWPFCEDCQGFGCWRNLDVRISQRAQRAGVKIHKHGMVEHLHDYTDRSWMKAMDFGEQFRGPLAEKQPITDEMIERHIRTAEAFGYTPASDQVNKPLLVGVIDEPGKYGA